MSKQEFLEAREAAWQNFYASTAEAQVALPRPKRWQRLMQAVAHSYGHTGFLQGWDAGTDWQTEQDWVDFEAELSTITVMRQALVACLKALDGTVDDEECRYDHHGHCQTHDLTEAPCGNERGKIAIDAARAVLGEDA